MKSFRQLSMTVLAITCLCVVSCGDNSRAATEESREASPQTLGGVKVPNWVANPGFGGVFGAVGGRRKSLGGYAETLRQAQKAGRAELANTISVKVQAAYMSYFQEGGEIFQGEDKPVYQTMATEMAEDVVRQLTDQVLQNSTQKDIWEHPTSSELFVWMIIDPSKMDIVKEQVKTAARQQVVRRSNVAAELKAKDALSRLDAAIDKELDRQNSQM